MENREKIVAIYGTKSRAITVYNQLKNDDQIHIKYFVYPDKDYIYDNGAENPKRLINSPKIDRIFDCDVISINSLYLKKNEIDMFIIPILNIPRGQILFHQIRRQQFREENVYFADTENISTYDSEEWLIPYFEFSYLPYLEFHVEDQCNLNCSACEHFAPLVKKSREPNIEKFKKDISQLKRFIEEIGTIRILGGEPLLNKDISLYFIFTRKLYPDADIRIVTNGLLLKDISDELLNKMKEYNIGFDVSLYPPMKDHIHNVVERIKLKGINVNVSDLVENFYKRFTLVSTNNGEREFSNCFQSFCNNLYDGKIAACFLPFTQHYFNEQFGYNIPSDGAIDLYDPSLTTVKLKIQLAASFERCNYCTSAHPSEWKRAQTKPTLSDWVVQEP